MIISTIYNELILRNSTPLEVRLILLCTLLLVAFFYIVNREWFTSMRLLSLTPFQKFNWESEKYSVNYLYRTSSLISIVLCVSIAIKGYQLGTVTLKNLSFDNNFLFILLIILVLFLIKFVANKIYFSLHEIDDLGDRIIDFQYSINQWFSLVLLGLFLVDFFYLKLGSDILILTIFLSALYFLIRLFGTVIIFQNNIRQPIITVFIYLCTYEISPALVIAKVLFVNS